MGVIIWAGVPSTSVGVVVERYPEQPGPCRRLETIQVPGRNGDLLIDQGAWDNYGQDYEVYFRAGAGRTPEAARIVRAWLMRPQGYQRLEDSYDPDFYHGLGAGIRAGPRRYNERFRQKPIEYMGKH